MAEQKSEVWGKSPPKKWKIIKRTGITRPRPDGGVIKDHRRQVYVVYKCKWKQFEEAADNGVELELLEAMFLPSRPGLKIWYLGWFLVWESHGFAP